MCVCRYVCVCVNGVVYVCLRSSVYQACQRNKNACQVRVCVIMYMCAYESHSIQTQKHVLNETQSAFPLCTVNRYLQLLCYATLVFVV